MFAALDTPSKMLAAFIAIVLAAAIARTAMDHLLPLRFRLKSMFAAVVFAAILAALIGYAMR